jgi:hypothetical protein
MQRNLVDGFLPPLLSVVKVAGVPAMPVAPRSGEP